MEFSKITYPYKKVKSDLQHKEKLNAKKIFLVYLLFLIFGFCVSLITYVVSGFFEQSWNTTNVSVFFLIPNIFELFALFGLHKILRKYGTSAALVFFLCAHIIFLSALLGLGVSKAGAIFMMGYLLLLTLIYAVLDVILESFSVDRRSGRIRGMYLTFGNVGFLFGPIVSMNILELWGYNTLFLVILLLTFIVFLMALFGLRQENKTFSEHLSARKIWFSVRKETDIFSIYIVSVALEFFYAIMVIYMPIYLFSEMGMAWSKIGFIFFCMLIPFVLLQYPAGRIADVYFGEKELIIFALLVMAMFTMAIPFVKTTDWIVWALLLFGTRVGAALVEILRDSYFYKKVDAQNISLIDFFRTARPIGIIVASGVSFVFLLFFSMKSVFFLLFFVLLLALVPAFRLHDSVPERERRITENIL